MDTIRIFSAIVSLTILAGFSFDLRIMSRVLQPAMSSLSLTIVLSEHLFIVILLCFLTYFLKYMQVLKKIKILTFKKCLFKNCWLE